MNQGVVGRVLIKKIACKKSHVSVPLRQPCVKSLEILSCWNWCQSQAGAMNCGEGKLGRNIPQDSIWLAEDLSQWMSVTKRHATRDACFYPHSSSRCLLNKKTLNRVLKCGFFSTLVQFSIVYFFSAGSKETPYWDCKYVRLFLNLAWSPTRPSST